MTFLVPALVALFATAFGARSLDTNWFAVFQQNIDKSDSACRNFYRAACPRDVPKGISISESARAVIDDWVSTERPKLIKEKGDRDVLAILSIAQLKYGSRLVLKSVREDLDFIGSLIDTVAIYRGLEQYPKRLKNVASFFSSIASKAQVYPLYVAGINDNSTTYVHILDEIIATFIKNNRFNLTARNVAMHLSVVAKLLRALKPVIDAVDDKRKTIIREIVQWGAINQHESIIVFPSTLIPAMTTSVPEMYGSLGYVVGHELMHTPVFRKQGLELYNKSCVTLSASKMCATFMEESCFSDESTFDEDFADIFGLRFAHDLLSRATIPWRGDASAMHKAFFSAFAGIWCHWYFDAQQNIGDVHSAAYVRVNSALNALPYFQQIYKCNENSQVGLTKALNDALCPPLKKLPFLE